MPIDVEYNSPITYRFIDVKWYPSESGHNRHTGVSVLSFVISDKQVYVTTEREGIKITALNLSVR
jgi:hypothetical protein